MVLQLEDIDSLLFSPQKLYQESGPLWCAFVEDNYLNAQVSLRR